MNKVIFCGRTTKDVEMRYSQGENSMAIGRFSIAIDSGYGDKKKTNFFNCTIFGKQAEAFEKYVPKGTKFNSEKSGIHTVKTQNQTISLNKADAYILLGASHANPDKEKYKLDQKDFNVLLG